MTQFDRVLTARLQAQPPAKHDATKIEHLATCAECREVAYLLGSAPHRTSRWKYVAVLAIAASIALATYVTLDRVNNTPPPPAQIVKAPPVKVFVPPPPIVATIKPTPKPKALPAPPIVLEIPVVALPPPRSPQFGNAFVDPEPLPPPAPPSTTEPK